MKNYILKTMCLAAGLVSFSACSDFWTRLRLLNIRLRACMNR